MPPRRQQREQPQAYPYMAEEQAHIGMLACDTIESLPPTLTRHLSDLKELDAVLSGTLNTIVEKISQLLNALEDPEEQPARRLALLVEVTEWVKSFKGGGDDKIRVVTGISETIHNHSAQLDLLASHFMSILPRNVVEKLPSTLAPNGYPALNPPPLPLRPSAIAAYSAYSYYPEPVRQPHPISSYPQIQPQNVAPPPPPPAQQTQPPPPATQASRGPQSGTGNNQQVLHQPQPQSQVQQVNPPSRGPQKPRSTSAAPSTDQPPPQEAVVPARTTSAGRARGSGAKIAVIVDGSAAVLEEAGDNEAYCYCRDVSFGQMIACDEDSCPMEWFHLSCAGLDAPPKGQWYCDHCRRKRASSGAPSGNGPSKRRRANAT